MQKDWSELNLLWWQLSHAAFGLAEGLVDELDVDRLLQLLGLRRNECQGISIR